MMRLVSKIQFEWIKDYIEKIKTVNIYKLADINLEENLKDEMKKRREKDEEEDAKRNELKEGKINEVKQRYLERKKLKKN
jgi:hypothetical protein